METKQSKEAIIIGGGAAGFMAAITASRLGARITILERKDRVLKKVLATGNGRCNYSNVHASKQNYYILGKGKVDKVLSAFLPEHTVAFFKQLGIAPWEEDNGKLYPRSLQSSSIVDALRLEAERLGVEIRTDWDVSQIKKTKEGFLLRSSGDERMEAKKILLAAGGQASPSLGSDGSGFLLAEQLGHSVTERKAALVQLKTPKHQVKGLTGIKCNARIKAFGNGRFAREEEGELLFADYGVSGSVIFDLSYLHAQVADMWLVVDFVPELDKERLRSVLTERKKHLEPYTMEQYFNGFLNKKLGQFLSKQAGIEKLSLPIAALREDQIEDLIAVLKGYRIDITDTTGHQAAQVTAGGVRLQEVEESTLESKRVPGLYFAGEVLDVYGDCGGYNLQWAWASGYVAGRAMAEASTI